MATTFQIVDTDLTTVLFDLNDENGTNNPDGVRTLLAAGGALGLGAGSPDPVVLSPPAIDGGFVVSNRVGLGTAGWRQIIRAPSTATTPDTVVTAVGTLAYLLGQGGTIKYVANNSAEVRYIDFEPSPAPALYQGLEMELYALTQLFQTNEGVQINLVRQPFLRGAELTAATNLLLNATLTEDFDATANRPDNWTWDSTTNLTAETITQTAVGGVVRGCYQFQKATGTAANLQQTTANSTYASGDVAVASFYARVVSGNSCQMQATVQFQTNAGANVGGLQSGGLVTLTGKWQRISVTTAAAGATTGKAQVSVQIDDTDANANVVQVCNVQAEKTSLTAFRVPSRAVAYNPTSTSLPRKLAVWAEGNAPTGAKLKVTADTLTMGAYRVYRVAEKATDILKATLHKSLRSGTLGTDTTSAADADAIDGNVALVSYTEPDPSFGTDVAGSGTSTTSVALAPPASLAVGDCMVAQIVYFREKLVASAPLGWQQVAVVRQATSILSSFHCWVKIADADDVAASTFTFSFLTGTGSGSGTDEYIAWIGRFPNVDPDNPVDTYASAVELATTAPTAPSITTTKNNNEIITTYIGAIVAASGSLTFTPPAGTTPTYTEVEDRQGNVTWRAMQVNTGNLATAGATGTKDATASASSDCLMFNMALNKATSVLQARSTVTYSGSGTGALPTGEYDVWLRYRTTAACFDRIRIEYALKASPTTWIALPDFLLDTRAGSTFTEFEEHRFGRIGIPDDQTLDTLTIRVSSGRELTSSGTLKLDCIYLAPAFERAGFISTPTIVANNEFLATVPSTGGVYHLSSTSAQSETAMVDGPVPVELQPGYQVLIAWPALLPITGYVDPTTEVTSSPTLQATVTPKYRT